MIMETPIITSDMGFAHTVCDRAAVYFDPINPAEIAQKIVQLVHDYELQQKLIQLGKERISYFGTSAQRTEEYLNICRNTLHEVKN
jgi:glycosyltransferase involved in cell wall biosynthesis